MAHSKMLVRTLTEDDVTKDILNDLSENRDHPEHGYHHVLRVSGFHVFLVSHFQSPRSSLFSRSDSSAGSASG